MKKLMTFNQAIRRASQGDKSTAVIQAIYKATGGAKSADPKWFYQWLTEWDYDGDEAPYEIIVCAEIDAALQAMSTL